jgi:hypothetical protein
MKLSICLLLLISFSAQAMPLMPVKERLRLHMWTYGLDQNKVVNKTKPQKILPEELERALRKI